MLRRRLSSAPAARFLDLATRTLLALLGGWALLTVLRAPGLVWIASGALAGTTAAAPISGVLILAGLVPIGPALASLSGSEYWSEPLVLAFLAGAALRGAVRNRSTGPTLPAPALLLALTVAASAVVQLAVRRVREGPEPFLAEMSRLVAGGYFTMRLDLGSLTGAALFLEGVALFVAVMLIVRQDGERFVRIVRMMVAGAAGAAALNVSRLLNASVATGEAWSALLRLSRSTRINVQYGDVNAAGSYFAMLLCLAIGLALAARRGALALTAFSAVLIALALWLTSSRAAILALLMVGAVAIGLSLKRSAGHRIGVRQIAAVGALTTAALLALAFLPNRVIGGNAAAAAEIRRDMALVSLRLFASEPVFGIGVGRFYEMSAAEMERLPVRRVYLRQNAHNNFLQILAELGVSGFVPFGLVLWLVVRGLRAGDQHNGAVRPAGAALGAFLLSALLGHPLLIPECAYAFWMLAGGAAGLASGRVGGGWTRSVGLAACALLLLSVPIRVRSSVGAADLEHLGYGLSQWQTAEDGERYRIADDAATVFVPGDAAVVKMPLRASRASAGPALVNVRLHGSLVDRVQVHGTSWTWFKFNVPEREGSRFIPLELQLAADPGTALHVGKVFVVQQRSP